MWQLAPIFHTLLRHKLGVFLLVSQIACSIIIISNMAYISQQILRHIHHPSGFGEHHLFAVTLRPLNSFINYAQAQRDISNLQALAGVEQVALSRWVPLAGLSSREFFRTSAAQDAPGQNAETVEVSPQILSTLGLPLIAGRNFSAQDMVVRTAAAQPQAKYIIVTRALAEALFGSGQNAVGKILYQDGITHEVIGVADNWLGFTIPVNDRAEKTAFFPSYTETDTEHRYLIRVKYPQQMAAIGASVKQLLKHSYNNELLSWIDTIDESRARANSQNWVILNLFLVLIITLGFVMAFAISGQTLFWITQRTKQIGIRRALGATRKAIIIHVLIENAMISVLGLLMGILLSLAVNKRVVQSTGTLPMSPAFLLCACALLLGLSLISAGVPAWRASKISPSLASRSL